MTWQHITKEVRDGRTVWLAVVETHFAMGPMLIKDQSIKDMWVRVILARYDTWEHMWRAAPTGELITLPKYYFPKLYYPCEIPAAPTYAEATKRDDA